MKSQSLWFIGLLVAVTLLYGCDLGQSLRLNQQPVPDQQIVKVFFKFGFRNQVDTFNGTLTKDLVIDGTISVPFSFTTSEQDSILLALTQSGFYTLPDTLYPIPNVRVLPDAGAQILRIQYQGTTKSLVWFYPLDESDPRSNATIHLWQTIRGVVESTPIYAQLPPAVGEYI